MGADEAVMERDHFVVDESGVHILDGMSGAWSVITRGQQVHFGGASIHIRNRSQLQVRISVADGNDGAVYTPVLFSDSANNSNLPFIDIIALGEQTILFESARRFLRFTVAPPVAGDVVFDLTQFPPRGRPVEVAAY